LPPTRFRNYSLADLHYVQAAIMPTPADRLRALLARPGLLLMPGCHDALSAKLVEQAGFPTAFMSGFAVSAVRLGLPDTGLISYGELVEQGRPAAIRDDIPLFGDGDTGFGNAVNVHYAVREFERAGAAGVNLEDQVIPKRCGHLDSKELVAIGEMEAKVRAARDAAASASRSPPSSEDMRPSGELRLQRS